MPLTVGTRLGPYEISALLGAGGMGEVYRARDERLKRDVAVKVIPAALAGHPDRLRRFETEARAAARLSHANIVHVYDVGSHGGQPYLVTELLEGESLRERLRAGPLSARRAIEFGIGVAQGLAAAHDQGIVHRDLKPENLFLTSDGRVKILDFGLAKLTRPEAEGDKTIENAPGTGGDTEAGVVLGTVGYMSPEQVRGLATDARSDIFTFGAILFEMVSGQRAFRGETPADTMSAILKEDPPDLLPIAKEIPPAFDRIVHRCLEKAPARRFRSAQDLAFSLEAISTTSPGSGAGALSAAGGARERAEVEFEQITHLRSFLFTARFAPDGQTVVYATRLDAGSLSLHMKRQETPEAIPIPIADADLLAVSPTGELAVQLDPSVIHSGVCQGTLALAPMFGGAPRPLAEGVTFVDFGPTGRDMVVVRETGGLSRLEYPMGKVLYQTAGHVSFPRISPRGDRIAFLDHAMKVDDRSSVAVIDLAGEKKTLTPEWASAQGLAWAPGGDEVWFAGTRGGVFRSSIYAASLSGEVRQIYAVPGSIRIMDVAKDGRTIVARDTYSAGILCAGTGAASERELGWLGYSTPSALSADGTKVLFTEQSHSVGRDYAVCIRGTDGSPVVRLGDGLALGLTPDGQWALAHLPYRDAALDLLPTGLGPRRSFPKRGYLVVGEARFTPDGAQAVLTARDEAGAPGLLVLGIADGEMRFLPLPAEFSGFRSNFAVDPSGREAVAGFAATGETRILPLDGSAGRPGPGLSPHDLIVDYAPDGASVYVQTGPDRVPLVVDQVSLETGSRSRWLEFMPADRAGLHAMARLMVSRDGTVFIVGTSREVGDLYLASGLG